MKKFMHSFLISLVLILSAQAYSQEIDTSIIQNLSSDQIAIAQEVLNSDSLILPD